MLLSPAPDGVERGHLFLDGPGTERFASPAGGTGPLVDVELEIGQPESLNPELLAEFTLEVTDMDGQAVACGGLYRPFRKAIQIGVAEFSERAKELLRLVLFLDTPVRKEEGGGKGASAITRLEPLAKANGSGSWPSCRATSRSRARRM